MYAVLQFESAYFCKPHRLIVAFHFCHVICIMTKTHVIYARYTMELASLIITCCYEHTALNIQQPQQIVQLASDLV